MTDICFQHKIELDHHVQQGIIWLSASEEGENTAALSYAAFELRFAVERLGIHYWATLLNRKPEENDLRDIESFKRIERRIYELAGHQNEINGHFKFMQIVFNAMNIDTTFHTPKIGELSKFWHDCSELCHIAWPLSCSVSELRKSAFNNLMAISKSLLEHVRSAGWPTLNDAGFTKLRNKFIAGEATESEVLAYLQHIGVWARTEFSDGRPSQFVGVPIPPKVLNPDT